MARPKALAPDGSEKMTAIPVRPDVKEAIKREAALRGMAMAEVVEEAWKLWKHANGTHSVRSPRKA